MKDVYKFMLLALFWMSPIICAAIWTIATNEQPFDYVMAPYNQPVRVRPTHVSLLYGFGISMVLTIGTALFGLPEVLFGGAKQQCEN